jgi:hypothetical protein
MLIRRPEPWELAACGAAVGGAAVWVLAVAARVGWLRALLDLYPRSSWDQVTWVLIPVLLILPLIVQGAVVALLSPLRPVPAGRGIVGSTAGTLLVLLAVVMVFLTARRLPAAVAGVVTRTLPVPLILGCGLLLIAGGLVVTGRALDSRHLRRAAVPAAFAAIVVAWIFARGWVLSASNVLSHSEAVAFFIAVAVGGGAGSAWNIRRSPRANLTGVERGRYNVPS